MNITLSTGKHITVRDTEPEPHSASSDFATCKGFGELVIGGLFMCHDLEEAGEVLSREERIELEKALDVEATRLFRGELAGRADR